MILELQQKNFSKVSRLLDVENCNMEPRSIVECNNPGWIFVDNEADPKTALIWSKGIRGFYITGVENNVLFNEYLNHFIDTIIKPRAKSLNYDCFEISCINPGWNSILKSVLEKRNLQEWEQTVFKYVNEIPDFIRQPGSNAGQIYKLDKVFFDTMNFDNMDFIINTLDLFWDSIENFLNKGVGYCAVINNYTISICHSSFISKTTHAIGIETMEEYRRKGLGEALVKEVLKEYKNRGISPYWDCTTTNTASYNLAEKTGFTMDFTYICYGFSI